MSVHQFVKKFSVQSVGDEPRRTRVSIVHDYDEAYAGIPSEVVQEDLEAEDEDEQGMNLFSGDQATVTPMSNWFGKLAAYTGGIEPTTDETRELRDKRAKTTEKKRLGTFLGVFLPCCQNILGILLFVRVGWITGVAGTLQSVIIVCMCCSCTMLTALSMSAIATNGKVPAGGSYFMISRSIGPEFGGAVGILFYFGTTVAAAMYLVGAVEVFLKYMCPRASLFGDITSDEALFNNTRVYGTILLLIVFCFVLLGIKFVSRLAPLGIVAVIFSITCAYLGVFIVSPSRSPYVCSLGGRLLSSSFYTVNGTADCSKNATGPIYEAYCGNPEIATNKSCEFFYNNELEYYPAMPGLSSNKFFENFLSSFYRNKGEAYDNVDFPPKREYGQGPNVADMSTSFMILLGIYFPSVTGIMAGSNRSGDLANPQVAVPLGTITAIAVTSAVYLSSPLLFSAICDGKVMRDKFGESYGGGLLVSAFAWPNAWVILIGSFLSTVGAGLQSLTGSPRLLQAIARDNVVPFLRPFQVTTRRGEPLRAQLLSYGIAQVGILIASIDSLTPLITMFFLMLYGFVNLATMLNGFLREPSWRPRFRFHHWFLSFIGLCLCIALMFISSWYYTIVAWVIAGAIYKYIEYRGASKEWGDATRGLQMSTAMRAILKLGVKPVHAKNWRPQILVYLTLDQNLQVRHDRLLDLVYQLKAGHGLTLVVSILEGDVMERKEDALQAKAYLSEVIQKYRIRGLPEVLVAENIGEGMKNMAQCAGLGNLRHNTLMLSFPEDWRMDRQHGGKKMSQFISTVRAAQACGLAMLVPKGIDTFPKSRSERMAGSVDVWCIVHDGGLLLLTSYLLMRNCAWRKCDLRIFVVASEGDDTVNLKKDMTKFMYDLRINASVEVVAMSTADISAYVAQRTATMEQRKMMLIQMKLSNNEARRDPQHIVDQHRKSISSSDFHDVRSNVNTKKSSIPNTATRSTVIPIVLNDSESAQWDREWNGSPANPPESKDAPQHNVKFVTGSGPIAAARERFLNEPLPSDSDMLRPSADTIENDRRLNEFTFSPSHPLASKVAAIANTIKEDSDQLTTDIVASLTTNTSISKCSKTIRHLHCSSRLNELLRTHSSEADLVIVNMPNPSRSPESDYYYMDYVELLTEGLPRVLLVRGTGCEVITAFSE